MISNNTTVILREIKAEEGKILVDKNSLNDFVESGSISKSKGLILAGADTAENYVELDENLTDEEIYNYITNLNNN